MTSGVKKAGLANDPPMISGLTPFILEFCSQSWFWMATACWLVMTPAAAPEDTRLGDSLGCWMTGGWWGWGEAIGGVTAKGLPRIT